MNQSVEAIISRLMYALKRRFTNWLLAGMDVKRSHISQARRFAPTAKLGPEGIVENIAGDNNQVVVDDHSYIRGRLLTYGHGGQITIGKWCYIGVRTEIWSMDSVTIGDRVLIAHNVNIHDGTAHSLEATQRHAHFRHIREKGHPRKPETLPGISSAPIIIEDDVWCNYS